jgi:phosphomannomutase
MTPVVDYRCPGELHSISRAVHLGRLAAFYPACRQCPLREDTASLSSRQVEQLRAVRAATAPRELFSEEGAGGVYRNDFTPAIGRRVAKAFGGIVQQEGPRESRQDRVQNDARTCLCPSFGSPEKTLLLAGDGRALTAEVTAAVGEGLRSSGCHVIDIGAATAACLGFAVRQLQVAGGVLVGNPSRQPHVAGLQFWREGPRPLSRGGSLEPLMEQYESGADHPVARQGQRHRFQAEEAYLAAIGEYHHALRPLRVIVDSASTPLLNYLQRLSAAVACQVLPRRILRTDLREQVQVEGAHFAVSLDGDGETCEVFDERGRAISAERMLLLLATPTASAVAFHGRETPTVVVENDIAPQIVDLLRRQGVQVVLSGRRRAEMSEAGREHSAVVGGGASGRFWHNVAGVYLPDGLMTVTRVLMLLSRSDEPFSALLDREAAVG